MDFAIRAITEADVGGALAVVAETLAEFGLEFGVGSETDDQVRRLPGSYASHGGQFFVAVDGGGAVVRTAGIFPVAEATYDCARCTCAHRPAGMASESTSSRPAWRSAARGVRSGWCSTRART